jgi:dephospho-CoA kinase
MAAAGTLIGLTGGVASGKSSVARAFEARYPGCVVDADLAARAVVEPGTEGLAAVVGHFGGEVLGPDGRLNRAALRARVFADAAQRKALEALLHPRIRAWMLARADAASTPYVVLDIPLLAEGGGRATWPMLDRIVVVDVPVAVQRARLMARDGVDAALAERMMAAQATRAQRLALADDIIVNLGSLADLDDAVDRLDSRWRRR